MYSSRPSRDFGSSRGGQGQLVSPETGLILGLFYNAVWAAHYLLLPSLYPSQRGAAPVWFQHCLSDRLHSEVEPVEFQTSQLCVSC